MKKGKVSTTGYRSNSKDKYNAFNIIPSNQISMRNVDFPVLGQDNLGNTQLMVPGQEYTYPGQYVVEVPYKKQGGNINTMKKLNTKGIAYPQQPTEGQFFQMTFNPNAPRQFYNSGGDVPCYDCGGDVPGYHMMPNGTMMADQNMKSGGSKWIQGVTKSIEQRGTKGRCTGSNFGGPDCPPGSPQYNLAVTFRKMAKKQFGGSSAPQNSDSDSIVDTRRNTMQNFLAQNTMRALAMDEADQMAGDFMQMGGNFGFDPNMYGQSMYADAVSQGKNQMHQDFGDFVNTGMNMAMNTNPYEQLRFKRKGGQIKMQTGGDVLGFYNTDGTRRTPEEYKTYLQGLSSNQMNEMQTYSDTHKVNPFYTQGSNRRTPQQYQDYLRTLNPNQLQAERDNPQYYFNSDLTTPNFSGSGSTTTRSGSSGSNRVTSGYGTGYSQQNYADECETLFNTQAEVDECVRQKQGLGSSSTQLQTPTTVSIQQSGPRGNYVEPQGVDQSNNGMYMPQQGNLAFISGQQPYGYFPMNNSPYYKMKGRGPMWGSTGAPNIAYNPNDTFLKDYEYKGRLFGQGPRKVTMTFQHGVPTPVDANGNVVTQPGVGTTGNTTTGATGPNQNFDAYLQQNIDPALYTKIVNGTATQEEFMEFNDEKMQLENQFQNSRMRQIPTGISPTTKISPKNRFANFQQNMQERGNRKGFRRNPPRESGVHPGFASKQYGGAMEAAQAGMREPMEMANPGDESTIVWKRKMGLDPENAVAWGLTGIDMLSSFGEAAEKRRNEEMLRARMNADALFQPGQFGDMSRGDYELNTGMFRPDQNVPVQFQGQNFGQIASGNTYKMGGAYQDGGEYYLTDEEIEQIKRMGGQIQFLD